MSEIVGIESFLFCRSFLFFWERQLLHSLWATWVIVLMWFRKKCYWVCPMRMTLEWHAQWMDFWCCFVQIVFRNLRMNVTSLVFEEITHQYSFEGNVFNSPAFCFSFSCNNSITLHNNSGFSGQRYVYPHPTIRIFHYPDLWCGLSLTCSTLAWRSTISFHQVLFGRPRKVSRRFS